MKLIFLFSSRILTSSIFSFLKLAILVKKALTPAPSFAFFQIRNSTMPFITGMFRSMNIRSGREESEFRRERASNPLFAIEHLYAGVISISALAKMN
jgi:hypothetical protein